MDQVKSVIQNKQKIKEPLTEAKAYWRGRQQDMAPFENQDFRLASPAQQMAIKNRRDITASTHLQGIREEEALRGTRVENVLQMIGGIYNEKVEEEKEIQRQIESARSDKNEKARIALSERSIEIQEARNKLLNAKDLIEFGYDVSADDLGLSPEQAIGDRVGGSISWRHNNPFNIKYGTFAERYGAKKGQGATDGGNFAVFRSEEEGIQAAKDLLKGDSYKNLSIEDAMRRWSGKGYGADVIKNSSQPMSIDPSIKIGTLRDSEIDMLMDGMRTREGWQEGTYLSRETSGPDKWTEARIQTLAKQMGENPTTYRSLSDADLDQKQLEYNRNTYRKAFNELSSKNLVAIGVNDEIAKTFLDELESGTTPEEIEVFLDQQNNPLMSKQMFIYFMDLMKKSQPSL